MTEYEEQCAFVDWLELMGIRFTCIPNATYTPSWAQKNRNRRMGLRAGLPDMLIVLPKGLLFIEMKRKKKSITSPAQKEWIKDLNKIQNVQAEVCKGADEAIALVKRLLHI